MLYWLISSEFSLNLRDIFWFKFLVLPNHFFSNFVLKILFRMHRNFWLSFCSVLFFGFNENRAVLTFWLKKWYCNILYVKGLFWMFYRFIFLVYVTLILIQGFSSLFNAIKLSFWISNVSALRVVSLIRITHLDIFSLIYMQVKRMLLSIVTTIYYE